MPTVTPSVSRRFRAEGFGLVALSALMALFFWWTMKSTDRPMHWGAQTDYYNLLVEGWLDGHLHMKANVPEALLKLADPYDPAQRPPGLGLHDVTLYRGKYYIYFGVAPAAVLLLPFRVLTGAGLPAAVAVWLFVVGGFSASVAVWWQVRVRYFPAAGCLVSLAGVGVLGLAGLGTVLLRRPNVYELAISGAYCFAMAAMWCVFRALHSDRRAVVWTAAASLAAGLAVGSRPSYVLAAPALLVPLLLWLWLRRSSTGLGAGTRWRMTAAAVLPLTGCGLLLALHNYLRFGSLFEFGVRYMLSGFYEARMTHFSPSYFGYNFWCYFLSTPRLTEWFPFIESRGWPPGPAGYMAGDGYYGVLSTLPLVWLGPIALVVVWWRRHADEERLRLWLTGTLLLAAGAAALLCGFYSSAGRYQVDFAPALALAGCVGALALTARLRESGWPRWSWLARGAIGLAMVWSFAFALLLSFQTNNEFRGNSPARFHAVARWFNVVPGWVSTWRGKRFGPVELRVRLPENRIGHREPLVTSGVAGHADFLFLEYLEDGKVRFGFDSWGAATIWSEALPLDASKAHDIRAVYGALAGPPILGRSQVVPVERLQVVVDGRVAWERDSGFHPASADRVYVGSNPIGGTACEAKFTGAVLATKRGD